MKAHWGRYLCVLAAGFVENIVHLIYGSYIEKTSSPQTRRYATRTIDDIQNPKTDRLIRIATSFDKSWGNNLEIFLDVDFRKEAINTIMSNRHLIAHGKNSDITIARVDQYLAKIVELAEFLEAQCGI
jgi:hypothetical protein